MLCLESRRRAPQIREKKSLHVKNYGIWLRYNSRSGTHNMYKEFRALTLCDAVNKLCTCLRRAAHPPRARAHQRAPRRRPPRRRHPAARRPQSRT